MDYLEVLQWYVGISVPFMISILVQLVMLVCKRQALPLTVKREDSTELRKVYKELEDACNVLPIIVSSFIIGLFVVFIATLKGSLWIINPAHNIRGLLELLSWEFKEI